MKMNISQEETSESQKIQCINRNTVHRICSGQVVLSLAVAVKELVENAIDAGATIINVHLKEYGSELVEVSDNGSGVCKENFQALTLKHYTSKIREFDDLAHIGTLGFRGEALSSLCALSEVTILTKHLNDDIATKICYDRDGKIISETATARQQGTTVTLANLFSTLPVRRKEFIKNLKREFSKMCQLLYAYCLVSKNVKFNCSNTTTKGSKSTVVATEGHNTVRENIISVFDVKQLTSLIEVEMITPEEDILKEYNIKTTPGEEPPFSFEFLVSTVTHGSGRSSTDRQFYFVNSRPCEPTKLMKLVNEIYKQFNSKQYPFVYLNITTKSSLVDVNITPDKRQVFLENEKLLLATVKASLLEAFKQFPSTFKAQNLEVSLTLSNQNGLQKSVNKGIKRSITDTCFVSRSFLEKFANTKRTKSDETWKNTSSSEKDIVEEADKKLNNLIEIACKLMKEDDENIVDVDDIPINSLPENPRVPDKDVEICLDSPEKNYLNRNCVTIDVDIADIEKKLKQKATEEAVKKESQTKIKFRSLINPTNNESAEDELDKQISKSDFKNMEVIGQFNLGFIIVNLNGDLFIVDQHATDEKYNYEYLQKNTVIDSQNLVCPKCLELTAASESILIENEEVFTKNGFAFKIDKDAPCTKKVLLTAVPLSHKFVFGKADIDEMIFMLQDSSHTLIRPSRVKAMFASRACRKSVMIGKALSKSDMRRLIDHMGEIDQPWNCPHGRPTMRHLVNLSLVVDEV